MRNSKLGTKVIFISKCFRYRGYGLLICLLILAFQLRSQTPELPNIIVFLSDDHGVDDAACYGNPDLKTPVLNRFAEEGMLFLNAYTPVSVCAPSRSSMLTGLYPHRHGGHQNHGSSAYERARDFIKRPKLELYNLEKDPYEMKNLINESKYQEITDDLGSELLIWMDHQKDPLLAEIKRIL